MNGFLKKLGIEFPGHYTDDGYLVVDLPGEAEFDEINLDLYYNQAADLVDSISQDQANAFVFEIDGYVVTMMNDEKNATYKLIVREKES